MRSNIPRSEFPRPDFVREDWICLNGEWEFSFDIPSFDRKILVPFCYQSALSGIGDVTDHDIVWYRRNFSVDSTPMGKRLFLKFGAVDSEADVWLNGCFLGSHQGGYVPFSFDITDQAREGVNEIVVRVEDRLNTDKPRGKQSWKGKPFACWYTPVTGIWQSVWLEYTGSVYINSIKLTPNVKEMEALCELYISEDADADALITASLGGNEIIAQRLRCEHGYGFITLHFSMFSGRAEELLWSPQAPNLVNVTVILCPGQGSQDVVSTYFGMRNVECLNGKVYLNGKECFQRLVLDQGYWEGTLLTPPSDEAIQKDIELTKAIGFNGVRKHQKLEDPRYYYWADKMGLLVWGELPGSFLLNDRAIRAASELIFEFVNRDYNHPCIITWVPMNESWGVPEIRTDLRQQDYCRMLTYHLKALDTTRLVSSNDGWEQISETGICGIHDYALFPSSISKYDDMETVLQGIAEKRKVFADQNHWSGQPVVITEFGGIAFADSGQDGSWGYYKRVKSNDEFLDRLAPVTRFLIHDGRFSGYCYTQLTDVMQEVNGILAADRQPKLPVDLLYRAFIGEEI